MITKPRMVRFFGRAETDKTIGDRVYVHVPFEPMRSAHISSISVHGFNRHIERQFLSLRARRGLDCDDFEIYMVNGLPAGIVYTRPMDIVELTQVRALRQKEAAALERQLDEEERRSEYGSGERLAEATFEILPAGTTQEHTS